MERRDVYENELTEEDRPGGDVQEDAAEKQKLDPDVDSEEADATMGDGTFGANPTTL